MDPREAFADALEDVRSALAANTERAHLAEERIARLQQALADGRPLSDVVSVDEPPVVVDLVSRSIDALHEHGQRLRRTEARALHAEGMTMDAIARLFGVSRQRVSTLLRDQA